jgi:hypothetical protein
VTVVVKGSATPKVIGVRSPGRGEFAMSSSRLFCQKQSAKATANEAIEMIIRVRSSSRCSTSVSRSSKSTGRSRAIDYALFSVTISPSTVSAGFSVAAPAAG